MLGTDDHRQEYIFLRAAIVASIQNSLSLAEHKKSGD